MGGSSFSSDAAITFSERDRRVAREAPSASTGNQSPRGIPEAVRIELRAVKKACVIFACTSGKPGGRYDPSGDRVISRDTCASMSIWAGTTDELVLRDRVPFGCHAAGSPSPVRTDAQPRRVPHAREIPRPRDGFVNATRSATGSVRSRREPRRRRNGGGGSMSRHHHEVSNGSPSSQCAMCGSARITRPHLSSWRNSLSGVSPDTPAATTIQVRCLRRSVRTENVPAADSAARTSGSSASPENGSRS